MVIFELATPPQTGHPTDEQKGLAMSATLMSGMRKEQRDQAAEEPRKTPLNFPQGRPRYARMCRRWRNRRYRLAAALLILGVATGVLVVFLAGWLTK